MKLKDYIQHLNDLVKENPKCLEFETIYLRNDKGNGFQKSETLPFIVYIPKQELEKYHISDIRSKEDKYKDDEPFGQLIICIN